MTTKSILLVLSIAIYTSINYAQTSQELTKTEIENLDFDFKKIAMPLSNAFEFKDKGGSYNLFLFEDGKMISKNISLNTKIFAVCYLEDHGGFLEQWTINDFIESPKEKNIWFLKDYCQFTDIDGDGFIEPVIVYGTSSQNNKYERIKIITIFKNKKYVIRAQECVLDNCRTFNKDALKKFPKVIQTHLESLLQKMRVEKDLILSNGKTEK